MSTFSEQNSLSNARCILISEVNSTSVICELFIDEYTFDINAERRLTTTKPGIILSSWISNFLANYSSGCESSIFNRRDDVLFAYLIEFILSYCKREKMSVQ